jgi:hypothetical protein
MGDYSEFEYPEFGFEKQVENEFTVYMLRGKTGSQISFKIMADTKETAILAAQSYMGKDWTLVLCH